MKEPARTVRVGADSIAFLVTSDESPEGIVAAEVEMPAGGGPPVMHRHAPGEVYRVEEGEFTFYLGEDRVERRVAGTGETVHIPANLPHTIRNESERPARAFVIYAPGEAMEGFIRDAGALAAAGPPEPAEVMAVAERHGIVFTGPAPSDP